LAARQQARDAQPPPRQPNDTFEQKQRQLQQPETPPPPKPGESQLPTTFSPSSVMSEMTGGGGSTEIHSSMTASNSGTSSLSLLSPEDMEYHRVSATFADASGRFALESSLESAAEQFASTQPLSTVSLFTAVMADESASNFEVVEGTTFYFDGPPPTTAAMPREPHIQPTVTQHIDQHKVQMTESPEVPPPAEIPQTVAEETEALTEEPPPVEEKREEEVKEEEAEVKDEEEEEEPELGDVGDDDEDESGNEDDFLNYEDEQDDLEEETEKSQKNQENIEALRKMVADRLAERKKFFEEHNQTDRNDVKSPEVEESKTVPDDEDTRADEASQMTEELEVAPKLSVLPTEEPAPAETVLEEADKMDEHVDEHIEEEPGHEDEPMRVVDHVHDESKKEEPATDHYEAKDGGITSDEKIPDDAGKLAEEPDKAEELQALLKSEEVEELVEAEELLKVEQVEKPETVTNEEPLIETTESTENVSTEEITAEATESPVVTKEVATEAAEEASKEEVGLFSSFFGGVDQEQVPVVQQPVLEEQIPSQAEQVLDPQVQKPLVVEEAFHEQQVPVPNVSGPTIPQDRTAAVPLTDPPQQDPNASMQGSENQLFPSKQFQGVPPSDTDGLQQQQQLPQDLHGQHQHNYTGQHHSDPHWNGQHQQDLHQHQEPPTPQVPSDYPVPSVGEDIKFHDPSGGSVDYHFHDPNEFSGEQQQQQPGSSCRLPFLLSSWDH
jgi:hypothetical protein